jgi:hypothetical protein
MDGGFLENHNFRKLAAGLTLFERSGPNYHTD